MTDTFLGFGLTAAAEAPAPVANAKLDYLARVAYLVRIEGGFTSKAQATFDRPATADAAQRYYDERDITAEDRALAAEAFAWATAQHGSDFADKLRDIVTKDGPIRKGDRGILAYAVGGLLRERADTVRNAARQAEDQVRAETGKVASHLGTVGDRGTFGPLTVDRVKGFEGNYGWTTAVTFRAADGGEAVWFASNDPDLEAGDVVTITGTVKGHSEYRGVPQTKLSRVAVVSNPAAEARTAALEKEAWERQARLNAIHAKREAEALAAEDAAADQRSDDELLAIYQAECANHPHTMDVLNDFHMANKRIDEAVRQLKRRGLDTPNQA